jgi:hypothetical protein
VASAAAATGSSTLRPGPGEGIEQAAHRGCDLRAHGPNLVLAACVPTGAG